MFQFSLVDILQITLLGILIWSSRKWSNPSLKASIDNLRSEFGFLRREVNKANRLGDGNSVEVKQIKENLSILAGRVDDLIEKLRNSSCSAFINKTIED